MPEKTREELRIAEAHHITIANEERKRLIRAAKQSRKRTVMMSIISSGIIALFIGRAVEVNIYNNGISRGLDNCERVQEDRRLQANQYGMQADQILGNPAKGIKPFKLEGTPFEDFKPLIIAQAKVNRKNSIAYANRIENCNKVYVKQHVIPFLHFT